MWQNLRVKERVFSDRFLVPGSYFLSKMQWNVLGIIPSVESQGPGRNYTISLTLNPRARSSIPSTSGSLGLIILLGQAALYRVGYLTASHACNYLMPVAHPSSSCNKQKCLQILPNLPTGFKSPSLIWQTTDLSCGKWKALVHPYIS